MARLAVFAGVASGHMQEVVVHNTEVHSVSKLLWGVFFEDINFAADGGIYAEMLRNRDFEALGRGNLGKAEASVGAAYTPPEPHYDDMSPWTPVGDVVVTLSNSTQPFPSNPTVVKLESDGTGGGLSNPGYWGIHAEAQRSDKLSFFAQTDHDVVLEARLVSESSEELARTSITVQAGGWAEYSATLTPTSSNANAKFQLLCTGPCSLFLDHISLFPGDAVSGLFRRDLVEKLKALPPAFVRFPGGNYLEGNDVASRWAWKKTIGLRQGRRGHYNSAWGYWVTDGLGLYEYLLLCEELLAAPQLSVYTGYSMGQPYVPLNESAEFVQDALDAIEFANGPSTTPYGKLRAEAGHAAAFGLDRFEVGNEEHDMPGYKAHFELIASAMRARQPNITIIGSGRWGPSIEGSPCLTGDHCDLWDDHYYRTPDVMANMSQVYDDYDRSLPDVFVGEYAANKGHEKTLQAALGEAMFMIGFERNADKVRQASFAPLFNNVAGTQWDYNMIAYNSAESYGIPSYFVQQLFASNRGDVTLAVNITGDTAAQGISACKSSSGTVIVKAVSYGAGGSFAVSPGSDVSFAAHAEVLTLEGEPSAENSFAVPLSVSPKKSTASADADGRFLFNVSPWSLLVIKIETSAVFV